MPINVSYLLYYPEWASESLCVSICWHKHTIDHCPFAIKISHFKYNIIQAFQPMWTTIKSTFAFACKHSFLELNVSLACGMKIASTHQPTNEPNIYYIEVQWVTKPNNDTHFEYWTHLMLLHIYIFNFKHAFLSTVTYIQSASEWDGYTSTNIAPTS